MNANDWLCPYCRDTNPLAEGKCKCGKSKVVVSHAVPYLDFLAANPSKGGKRTNHSLGMGLGAFYSRYIRPHLFPVGQELLWCLRSVRIRLPNNNPFEIDFVVCDKRGRLHSFIVWGRHSQFSTEEMLKARADRELPIIKHADMAYPFLNLEVVEFVKNGVYGKVYPKESPT